MQGDSTENHNNAPYDKSYVEKNSENELYGFNGVQNNNSSYDENEENSDEEKKVLGDCENIYVPSLDDPIILDSFPLTFYKTIQTQAHVHKHQPTPKPPGRFAKNIELTMDRMYRPKTKRSESTIGDLQLFLAPPEVEESDDGLEEEEHPNNSYMNSSSFLNPSVLDKLLVRK